MADFIKRARPKTLDKFMPLTKTNIGLGRNYGK
jgi:hypothetical protein